MSESILCIWSFDKHSSLIIKEIMAISKLDLLFHLVTQLLHFVTKMQLWMKFGEDMLKQWWVMCENVLI